MTEYLGPGPNCKAWNLQSCLTRTNVSQPGWDGKHFNFEKIRNKGKETHAAVLSFHRRVEAHGGACFPCFSLVLTRGIKRYASDYTPQGKRAKTSEG